MSESTTDEPSTKRPKPSQRQVHLAVAGCAHGEMDRIYDEMKKIENSRNFKFDLLICCGDYQAIRNYGDLKHMHVLPKYQRLNTFYQYYSGEKTAPVLTVFVGGNHESSGFMSELPYGGWVAPNIFYMGFASVVEFAGLRIAGLSGIYKDRDYNKGHFERPPYQHGSQISAYHVRSIDVFRLKQLKAREEPSDGNIIDVMISHDWPVGITDPEYGNLNWLLKIKSFFREDIEKNQLGNKYTMDILKQLRPRYWFAAHMHVKYPAVVPHVDSEGKKTAEDTHFMALDKPTPNPKRQFLDVFHIPISEEAEMELKYDPVWLAILRNTNGLVNVTPKTTYLPTEHNAATERYDFRPTAEEIEEVRKIFSNDFTIPRNFRQTAPPHEKNHTRNMPESFYYRNPQSAEFAEKLGIADINRLLCDAFPSGIGVAEYLLKGTATGETSNPDEIDINDDDFGDEDFIVDIPDVRASVDNTDASNV